MVAGILVLLLAPDRTGAFLFGRRVRCRGISVVEHHRRQVMTQLYGVELCSARAAKLALVKPAQRLADLLMTPGACRGVERVIECAASTQTANHIGGCRAHALEPT